ncbi:MAG: hypothetical protein ACP5HG_07390 [Anaerolineae bacterium]
MNWSRFSLFCDRALEAGWLIGVTITPVFFNVYSSRVFEPDKLTTLRSLALVMAVLWLARFIEERTHDRTALRFSLQTPMVLPALITMATYVISTVASLVPYTSLIGSYQRLQGTYTLFGYLVLFFAVLTSLRTRVQLSRLITVLILNSLPVSLYGIIQHNGLDPLPWAGDVTRRVASNMGNAIFVAAYLVMIVPLTATRIVQSFGDILGREEARISDVLRASGYIFIFAVQLLTIWYSRSRGPWLGIVAAGFVFPYLALIVLQRQAIADEESAPGRLLDIAKGFGFGVGSLVLAGVVGGLAFWALRGILGAYVGVGLAVLIFGGVWLHFIVERRGWRWLWIGWGSVGLIAALGLVAINVPGPLQTQVRQVESLRRLTTITQLQEGTGKVRGLIWQGTVDLIGIHEPITFPDGSPDRLNPIRPLVGYGPESMYVAYNSFYPAELGHYESRTASPDRSHNETLDSLVFTGIPGLAAYLFTFGSFFVLTFRWLGLLRSRRQLLSYLGLDVLFAVIFFLIGWRLEGAYLVAVAIPLGLLVGTMVYLTLQAFRSLFTPQASAFEPTASEPAIHPHAMLLMGLMAGVLAHFVEINFGIAIAATRAMFWTFAGLLVVLGLNWVPGRGVLGELVTDAEGSDGTSFPSRSRRQFKRARRNALVEPWLAAVLALSLASTFLLGTLAFDFINNPDRLGNATEIFVRSLTTKYFPEPMRAYGALMIVVFTWALFGVIGLSEFDREGLFEQQRSKRWPMAIIIYASLSLVGFRLFGGLIAGHQAALTRIQVTTLEQIPDVADTLTDLLGFYYGLIFVVLLLMGWVLMQESRRPRASAGLVSVSVMVVLLLVSIVVVRDFNYNLIRADIIFKQGGAFANSSAANEKQVGIQHYDLAISYAPREDYYYLFLGKALLELAQDDEIPSDQREPLFLETEDVLMQALELNPLNTDHSANLARFYKSWAARVAMELRATDLDEDQVTELTERRQNLLQKSVEHYEIALTLSPQNPILWNELAQLYAIDLGNEEKFEETIVQSLLVDDEFEQTWMLIGDIRSSEGDIEGAIEAYQQALEIKNDCTVRRVVGTLMAQQERWEEATSFLEASIEMCPEAGDLWEMYRVLAIAHTNQGDMASALEAAQISLALAPEAQRTVVEQLIEQLQGDAVEPVTPVSPSVEP